MRYKRTRYALYAENIPVKVTGRLDRIDMYTIQSNQPGVPGLAIKSTLKFITKKEYENLSRIDENIKLGDDE